jgi:hypothetical protein
VYAPPGAKLLLDFVTDGFKPGDEGSVRVRVEDTRSGELRFESLLASAGARHFTLPGSGDVTLDLSLLDTRGRPLTSPFARDRCTVTQNEVAP